MMEVVVTTGAVRRAKFQPKYHHQQTNTSFLQTGCPSCNQQCQSTEGKYYNNTAMSVNWCLLNFYQMPH